MSVEGIAPSDFHQESVRLIDETTYECVVKQKVGSISVKLKFINRLTKVEKPTHIEVEGQGALQERLRRIV